MKRVHISKVIHTANVRGLWVMTGGSGDNFKYDFYDKKTGKLVLTYYPTSKHWLGTQDKQGRTDNYRDALIAGLGLPPITTRGQRYAAKRASEATGG